MKKEEIIEFVKQEIGENPNLFILGWEELDDWFYFTMQTKNGERATNYSDLFVDIENKLKEKNVYNVLFIPEMKNL